MAPRIVLNAKTIETLGAKQLSALIVETAHGNPALKRRLRLALAARQGSGTIKKQLNKQLDELRRDKHYIDGQNRKAFVKEIAALHGSISTDLAEENPTDAMDVLWRLMDMAGSCYERYDDSNGTLVQVFADARLSMGDMAIKAKLDPTPLSLRVFAAYKRNEYGEYDKLVSILAPALGSTGLKHLQRLIEKLPPHSKNFWKHEALQEIEDALGV